MQYVFTGETADCVWQSAFKKLEESNSSQGSRIGNTCELLHVGFHIKNPQQRWVTTRTPVISPAFAIAEVFWILAGMNEAEFINFWNPILPKFSGDGAIYHGAYGHRLRNQFGLDQIERAYSVLKSNPSSRQVVLQLWDPKLDIPDENGKPAAQDIPCNVCSILKVRDNKLEWLQIMRSNDLIRGTPYNFIQFTTLQEIMAGWLDLEIGTYTHVSDSLHVYHSDIPKFYNSNTQCVETNTDNLKLSKIESKKTINLTLKYLHKLTSNSLTTEEFSALMYQIDLVTPYKNLFMICAADAARRRGWDKQREDALKECCNNQLKSLYVKWMENKE